MLQQAVNQPPRWKHKTTNMTKSAAEEQTSSVSFLLDHTWPASTQTIPPLLGSSLGTLFTDTFQSWDKSLPLEGSVRLGRSNVS